MCPLVFYSIDNAYLALVEQDNIVLLAEQDDVILLITFIEEHYALQTIYLPVSTINNNFAYRIYKKSIP